MSHGKAYLMRLMLSLVSSFIIPYQEHREHIHGHGVVWHGT